MSLTGRKLGPLKKAGAASASQMKTQEPPMKTQEGFSSREVAWPEKNRPAAANSRGKGIDVHELLKREAFKSPNDASDNHFEKNRPSPDAIYGASDHYVVLDTFEQAASSDPQNGRFDWNFMVQGTTGNQVIGVKDTIATVIEAQIATFNIPPPLPAPYVLNAASSGPAGQGVNTALPVLVANGPTPSADSLTSSLSQMPFGGKVTIELMKLGLQSFSDAKNARHHFELQASHQLTATAAGPVDSGVLTLTPLHNNDIFVFTDPLQAIHGLNLQFRNPDYPLKLPNSVFTGVAASVDSAAQYLTFSTATAHGLAAGDRVYFSGFTSANPIINNWVNSTSGLVVGTGGLTATAFRLNPDVDTTLLNLALGASITSTKDIKLYIAKNRIRVPFRFRGVVPRLTNYIGI